MSIRVMNNVWESSKATGSTLLVLLAIADFADDDGQAYPGVSRLAKKARISERTVQRACSELGRLGELEVIEGGGIDTVNGKTNRYIVKFNGVTICPGVTSMQAWGDIHDANGVTRVSPKPSVGRTISNKPSEERALLIFAVYPKKIAKPAALKAINKALKKIDFETLLAKTKAFAVSCLDRDAQFIPYPATWFNQERYSDDIEAPALKNSPHGEKPKFHGYDIDEINAAQESRQIPLI